MPGGRRPLVAGPVLAVLLTLAACTGDDDGASTSRPDAPAPSSAADEQQGADWPRVTPGAAGLDPPALRQAIAVAGRRQSGCFLVARGEQVVAERYWGDGGPEVTRTTFSVTKSVTSTLVGLAAGDGDLALTDRAARYVREWRGTPSAAVRVRDLLSNVSGRAWSMESDYPRLHGARDRTAYAVGLGQDARPGEVWAYNNAAIQTLDRVLRVATGTPTDEYAEERLFAPLGMTSTGLDTSEAGATSTYAWMTSTCRDLARFGLLFARDGVWDGEPLLPRGWVRDAVGRPSQPITTAYGLLWWLNRPGPVASPLQPVGPALSSASAARPGQLIPGAPSRLFAALGLGGQVVLVDPRTDTVVVRLGDPSSGRRPDYTVRDAALALRGAQPSGTVSPR